MRATWIVAIGVLVATGACGRDEAITDARAGIDANGDGPVVPPVGPASGWITLLEQTGPFAGTYAYAEITAGGGTRGRYGLAHLTEVERIGDCRYLAAQPYACDPVCPANWVCVLGAAGNPECRYGYGQDVGTISITGGAVPIAMPFLGYYGTANDELPADVFAEGDTITASAPGAAVGAFSVTAHGVAPLDASFPGGNLTLVDGVDKTITWTQGTTPAQIWFAIGDTYSHGGASRNAIECTAPDSGSLTIDGELIRRMPPLAPPNCSGLTCTVQVLRRFTSGTAALGDGDVELVVGSDVTFWVEH